MNILNMYVLQCILCACGRKFFRIYDALQIKIIIIITAVINDVMFHNLIKVASLETINNLTVTSV